MLGVDRTKPGFCLEKHRQADYSPAIQIGSSLTVKTVSKEMKNNSTKIEIRIVGLNCRDAYATFPLSFQVIEKIFTFRV